MSFTLEFDAKTADEALDRASKELNIPRQDIKYDILSHGSTGIFGLVGAKRARIRVHVPKPESRPLPEKESGPDKKKKKANTEKPKPLPAQPPEASDESQEAELKKALVQEEGVSASAEEVADKACEALEAISSHIMPNPKVSVQVVNSRLINLDVEGEEAAVLIGRKGVTLEAAQYLVEKMATRGIKDKIRVHVDVGGYHARREENLTRMAQKLRNKVQRTGKPQSLSPMNAKERRIVHMVLKDDHSVRTHSKGSGSYRRVVISPKKNKKSSNSKT